MGGAESNAEAQRTPRGVEKKDFLGAKVKVCRPGKTLCFFASSASLRSNQPDLTAWIRLNPDSGVETAAGKRGRGFQPCAAASFGIRFKSGAVFAEKITARPDLKIHSPAEPHMT